MLDEVCLDTSSDGVTPAAEKIVAMLVSGGLEHAGGIGRWAGYLDTAWRDQGLSPKLEIVDTRGHGGVWVGAVTFAAAIWRLFSLWRAGRLGVIHANLSVRGSTVRKYLAGWVAGLLGVPMVVHLHGSGYDDFYSRLPGWAKRRVLQLFAKSCHVIVLGEAWANWAAATLSVPLDKISVLYNGVSRPRTAPAPRDGPCHIVLLGRIGARKGVPELIEALASGEMQARAWRATLAGDGEVALFRQQVLARGLSDRVDLPGWLDQAAAAALLATADILVLPSHFENSPISIIEALAHGVPVVSTPVGTTAELLTDGESALLVPVGNVSALAAALARLIDSPKLRQDVAAAGHAIFLSKLDIDMLARKLAGMHRSMLRPA